MFQKYTGAGSTDPVKTVALFEGSCRLVTRAKPTLAL